MNSNLFSLATLTFSMIVFASVTRAEVRVAKSQLWQAPYESSIAMKIGAKDSWLVQECAKFKEYVLNPDGSIRAPSGGSFDALRTLAPSSTMAMRFSTTFQIENGFDWLASNGMLAEKDRYPLKAMNLSESRTRILSDTLSSFNVVYQKGSLTAAAIALGLRVLPIRTELKDGRIVVRVEGKDAACDLIDGKALLRVNAEATVVPSPEDQRALDRYFKGIEAQIAPVLQTAEPVVIKTARVSYRLGAVLNEEAGSAAEAETSLVTLISYLFKPNSLELSSAWQVFAGKPVLVVSGSSVRKPVELTLSVQ